MEKNDKSYFNFVAVLDKNVAHTFHPFGFLNCSPPTSFLSISLIVCDYGNCSPTHLDRTILGVYSLDFLEELHVSQDKKKSTKKLCMDVSIYLIKYCLGSIYISSFGNAKQEERLFGRGKREEDYRRKFFFYYEENEVGLGLTPILITLNQAGRVTDCFMIN